MPKIPCQVLTIMTKVVQGLREPPSRCRPRRLGPHRNFRLVQATPGSRTLGRDPFQKPSCFEGGGGGGGGITLEETG